MHHAFVVTFNAVQQAVHQGQTAGVRDQFDTDKGLVLLEGGIPGVQLQVVVSLLAHILVGGDQKACGSRCWVLYHLANPRF